MKKFIRISCFSLAILFVLLTATISFLVSTTTGLRTTIYLANWFAPGQLTVQEVDGNLLRKWSLRDVHYQAENLDLSLDWIKTNWHLSSLLRKKLVIKQLKMGSITIHTMPIPAHDEVEQPAHEPTATEDIPSWQLPIQLSIQDLSIGHLTFNAMNLSDIHLSAQLTESVWHLKQLSTKAFDTQINIQGKINPNQSLSAHLKLSLKASNANGVSGHFAIKGDWYDYAWKGYLTAPTSLLTSGHIKQGDTIAGETNWRDFTYPGKDNKPFKFGAGRFEVSGDADKMTFALTTSLTSPYSVKLKATGFHSPDATEALLTLTPKEGQLTARVSQKTTANQTQTQLILKGQQINLSDFGLPLTHLAIRGQAQGDTWSALQANLRINGQYLSNAMVLSLHKTASTLDGDLTVGNNRIQINGKVPFPIEFSGSIPSPHQFNPSLNGLRTQITLSGRLDNAATGNARLIIDAGSYQNPDDKSMPPLAFTGGKATIALSKQGINLNGQLAIDSQKILRTRLSLPGLTLQGSRQSPQTVIGNISFNLNSLSFLNQLSPLISEANGQVFSTVSIRGPIANPDINGQIRLQGGTFKLSDNKTPFTPVTATVSTTNHQWQVAAAIHHQNSQLSVSGKGTLAPNLAGSIQITGNQFLSLNTQEYQVYLSPALTVSLSPNLTRVDGEIIIPKAKISPQTFSSSVTLSDDVVFSQDKQEDAPPSHLFLNIGIKMGDEVKLLVQGLSARITGAINVQKQGDGPITSSGQLSLADGKYAAYGQKLDISQGELFFTGGSITNPGINVRATRTFNTRGSAFSGSNRLFDFGASNIQTMSFANTTTVGIQVTGRVNNPKISLFSEPANMQQSDILSMLLLGQPAGQASNAGGQLLLSAITSMGLDKGGEGSQLLSQLQSKLGLEFDMNDSSTYDRQQDEVSSTHSLGVRKKFSDRLSVGYKMGVFDSNSMVITLTYLLNKFLSVEVNAGDNGSGIDLTYTRSKD